MLFFESFVWCDLVIILFSSCSSSKSTPSLPTQLCILFSPPRQMCAAQVFFDMLPSTRTGLIYQGLFLRENWFFLSWYLRAAHSKICWLVGKGSGMRTGSKILKQEKWNSFLGLGLPYTESSSFLSLEYGLLQKVTAFFLMFTSQKIKAHRGGECTWTRGKNSLQVPTSISVPTLPAT